MVKELIEKITGVSVTSDDLDELLQHPEKYTQSKEDLEKVRSLIQLIELWSKLETKPL